MSPNRSTGDVTLVHCLDASVQSSGCKIDLQTPAGPLSMTLPPGLKDGQTLRLAGRGELGPDGKRGDVLLTVSFFSISDSVVTADKVEPPSNSSPPKAVEKVPLAVAKVDEEPPKVAVPVPSAPKPTTARAPKAPTPSPPRVAKVPDRQATPTPIATPTSPEAGSGDGITMVLVVVALIALFVVFQMYDTSGSSPTKRPVAKPDNRPTPVQVKEKMDNRLAAKLKESNEASLAADLWNVEKKKLVESDPDHKPISNSRAEALREMNKDTGDIGDPKDWVTVRATRYVDSFGRIKRQTYGDHINISKRMGVDAESMATLTAGQSRQRFCEVVHCLFFGRSYPAAVIERLGKDALRDVTEYGKLETLVARVQGKFQNSQFEIQFTEEDAKGMEHWKWMEQMNQWKSDSNQVPAMAKFNATKAFEQQWLSNRKERGLRFEDMSWWYERAPLLYDLQRRYNFSADVESHPRPKLTLDEEIIAKLTSMIHAKATASDRLFYVRTSSTLGLQIQEVSVRNAE